MRHHDPSNHDMDDLPSRLAPSTPSAPSHPLLLMQRRLGNQAVMRHLRRKSGLGLLIQRVINPAVLNNLAPTPPEEEYMRFFTQYISTEYGKAMESPSSTRKQAIRRCFNAYVNCIQTRPLHHLNTRNALSQLITEINRPLTPLELNEERVSNESTGTDEPLFGTEFTFTNSILAKSKNAVNNADGAYANKKVEKWKNLMSTKPNVVSTEKISVNNMDAYRFTFRNGWWYVVSRDHGCLEMQTKPLGESETYDTVMKNQIKLIFEIAVSDDLKLSVEEARRGGSFQDENLATHRDIGGGHLSMDSKTTFGRHARAFRNYLVLYVNNHHYWGQYDDDALNAPMITELPRQFRQAFAQLIQDFDTAYTNPNVPDMTIETLATRLETEVYRFVKQNEQIGQEKHFQAINVEHLSERDPNKRRIEMRRFRAQTGFDDFLNQLRDLTRLRDEARDYSQHGGLVPLTLDTTTRGIND